MSGKDKWALDPTPSALSQQTQMLMLVYSMQLAEDMSPPHTHCHCRAVATVCQHQTRKLTATSISQEVVPLCFCTILVKKDWGFVPRVTSGTAAPASSMWASGMCESVCQPSTWHFNLQLYTSHSGSEVQRQHVEKRSGIFQVVKGCTLRHSTDQPSDHMTSKLGNTLKGSFPILRCIPNKHVLKASYQHYVWSPHYFHWFMH